MYWSGGLSALVVAVALAALGGGAYIKGRSNGYEKRDLMCKAEIAAVESRAIEAERQATALREKGRILADRLATQAAEAQAALDAARRDFDATLNARTSALKRNLDASLVRLLNELTPVRSSGDPASAAASGVAPQVSSTRSDTAGFASERAVVRAIADCRIGYEACRQRHGALATYVEEITR